MIREASARRPPAAAPTVGRSNARLAYRGRPRSRPLNRTRVITSYRSARSAPRRPYHDTGRYRESAPGPGHRVLFVYRNNTVFTIACVRPDVFGHVSISAYLEHSIGRRDHGRAAIARRRRCRTVWRVSFDVDDTDFRDSRLAVVLAAAVAVAASAAAAQDSAGRAD